MMFGWLDVLVFVLLFMWVCWGDIVIDCDWYVFECCCLWFSVFVSW